LSFILVWFIVDFSISPSTPQVSPPSFPTLLPLHSLLPCTPSESTLTYTHLLTRDQFYFHHNSVPVDIKLGLHHWSLARGQTSGDF
jgi:hypothetical protein